MQKRIIIVHGEKPPRSGGLHPEFRERLDACIKMVQPDDVVIVTGGKT